MKSSITDARNPHRVPPRVPEVEIATTLTRAVRRHTTKAMPSTAIQRHRMAPACRRCADGAFAEQIRSKSLRTGGTGRVVEIDDAVAERARAIDSAWSRSAMRRE